MTSSIHPVDRYGLPVSDQLRSALESAFRWVVRQFPLVDEALIATWAEEVALSMSDKAIQSPRRYAVAAMHGKVREFYRAGGLREATFGVSSDLEALAGTQEQTTRSVERKILFDQLRSQLNERDRLILVLLRQDVTSPAEIADALGVSYEAAAKAIQRVRDRLREILVAAASKAQSKKEVQS